MRSKTSVMPVLLVLLVAGCSQNLYMQGKKHLKEGRYEPAIDAFYQELITNPTNSRAWRELGVTYYEKGNLSKAEDALVRADSIQPDSRAQLFLGLLYEKQDDFTRAINAYTTSLSLQSRGKTANMTRAHLDRLMSRKYLDDVALALENESKIDVQSIPEHTIAVVNFDGSLLSPDISPIARGLAEFTAIDLAKVKSLTVVERLKIDILTKELKLGASGYVDPATAPRVGRLMGSRKLITGSVLSIGEEGIKLDATIVNTIDSSSSRGKGIEGALNNFFKLQKEFVFDIIDDLGVALTAAERDAISEFPTESYLAFLAYCRGLDYENRGMHRQAELAFAKAVHADKNFQQANQELQDLSAGAMDYRESFNQLEGTGRSETGPEQQSDGLDSRLANIAADLGAIPSPTGDSDPLNPAPDEETGTTGTVVIEGDLDAQ